MGKHACRRSCGTSRRAPGRCVTINGTRNTRYDTSYAPPYSTGYAWADSRSLAV